MMTFLLSAACLQVVLLVHAASVGAVPPLSHLLDDSYTFEAWMATHQKTYADEERVRRKGIFEDNLRHIIEHNKKGDSGHVRGVNHLMDLESHELSMGYDKSFHEAWKGRGASDKDSWLKSHQMDMPFDIDDVSTLPKSVDWRAQGVVTPVKNQGICGSCWAHASTAVLESHIAIQTGVLFTLSVQELVSCVPNPRNCGGSGGCSGATGYLAMDFVASEGIVDEWQIGYQSYGGDSPNCTFPDNSSSLRGRVGRIGGPRAAIEGYAILPTNDYKATMNAVAKMGPLVVAVACSNWHLYSGGVFTDYDKSPTAFDINHAVVLTGYGTDEETGEDFWLIRNSWGPRWGENGYIRLKRVDPETLHDPDKEDCGMDVKPNHGETCEKDEDGNPITPPAVKVCGTNGMLFDPVLPIGGHLM